MSYPSGPGPGSGSTVTVNVGALSNALAVAIQQATDGRATAVNNTGRGSASALQSGNSVSLPGPSTSTMGENPATTSTRPVGRPRKAVEVEDILSLRSLHYTWTKVSAILGISRATLYRRLEEVGISPDDHSHLSNQELDEMVRSIKRDHPNDGEVLLQGHLHRLGVRVPRQAIRNSIHRTDHANVVARRRTVIRRRIYSVPYPNYMWHIDGHHKLIRWRFVIHGAIDGFSRTIIYLQCCDNNRSQTVLSLFQDGVSHFGLPDHIRSDHGGENIAVWRYMIAVHHYDYACVVTGSSVHNERVERLWRDVHRCVASTFAEIFRSLERDGYLDPLNEVDQYCLHHVFTPRINKCITEFKESWNQHALSTEGNNTPYQLLFEGLNHVCGSTNPPVITHTNIDVSGLTQDQVVVPGTRFVPCSVLQHQLRLIDPLQSCADNGIAFYMRAIQAAGQHLGSQCIQCILA